MAPASKYEFEVSPTAIETEYEDANGYRCLTREGIIQLLVETSKGLAESLKEHRTVDHWIVAENLASLRDLVDMYEMETK